MTKLSERLEALRWEPATGATLAEMRENLSGDLKNAGDCKLVWFNEGDLLMLPTIIEALKAKDL